jgi:heat shock protein HslJ
MIRYSLTLLMLVCALGGTVVSCTSTSPDPITPTGFYLDGTHWRLQHIYRRVGPDIELDDSDLSRYILHFDPHSHIGGTGDCNQFSGDYTKGYDDTITVSNLVTTLIGCPDPFTEQRYLDGLSSTIEYRVDSYNLLLYCNDFDVAALYFYRF